MQKVSEHLGPKAVHPTAFLGLLCSFSAHSDSAAICPRLSLKHLSQYQASLCKHWSSHCLTTLKTRETGGHRRFCGQPGTKWTTQNLRPKPLWALSHPLGHMHQFFFSYQELVLTGDSLLQVWPKNLGACLASSPASLEQNLQLKQIIPENIHTSKGGQFFTGEPWCAARDFCPNKAQDTSHSRYFEERVLRVGEKHNPLSCRNLSFLMHSWLGGREPRSLLFQSQIPRARRRKWNHHPPSRTLIGLAHAIIKVSGGSQARGNTAAHIKMFSNWICFFTNRNDSPLGVT